MNEPKEVTAPNGKKRWRGGDGRTYDTFEEAWVASGLQGPVPEPPAPEPLKVYHLTSEAQPKFLQFGKNVWVAADSPEMAVAYSAYELEGRRGPITVYDYADGPPGIVPLEDGFCVCRTFSEAEHRRIFDEHGMLLKLKFTRYST